MRKILIFTAVLMAIGLPSFSQQNTLETSIEKDDLELFKKATSRGLIIELLTVAIQKKAVKIAEYIIQEGIDVNEYDSLCQFALLEAVRVQNESLVKQLLESGANPNMKQKDGLEGTPLMFACSNKNVSIINALLEAGADVNAIDINKDPALNWATYYGNIEVMQLLIDKGADLKLRSKHGEAVDVAFRLWHADSIAQVFVPYSDKPISPKSREIISAIRSNDQKRVAKLLKQGIDPNTTDALGTPLLHLAAQQGRVEMSNMLLEAGGDVNGFNRVGQTALALSARFGHEDMVKLLLDKGADPNATGTEYQLTPMIGAAVSGHLGISNRLITAGAKINHTDVINGGAALHWAMFYGHLELGKSLLDKGADHKSKVLDGNYTAKTLAEAYGYTTLVDYMDYLDNKENPLFGTWLMKEIHYEYPDTTYKVQLEYPGRLIVHDNRYSIMYNPYGNQRKSAKSLAKIEEDEMIYAFKTMAFNSGTYEISDDVLITTADMAKVAGFEGGVQHYRFQHTDTGTQMTMFDETYPNGNKPEWYGKLEIRFIMEKE